MILIEHPPDEWIHDHEKDFVMACHYCLVCRECRYDRLYDPLSKSSEFCCLVCKTQKQVGEGVGFSLFILQEHISVAYENREGRFRRILYFLKLGICGLGEHLPDDRKGRTAGELELEALHNLMTNLLLKHKED